jgi:probable O-glycosylation ligase (exosortase A-associated)
MIPLTVLTVIMTHSRGGFLTLIAILGTLVWRSRNRVAGIAIGFAILIVGALAVPQSYVKRISTIGSFEDDGSAMGRIAAWKTAMNMTVANPIVGVGYDMFQWNYRFYASGMEHEGRRVAHNAYFQVMAECGIPALAMYLFLIFATIRSLWKLRRDAQKLYHSSWIINYATMFETTMIAFVVGSTFLNRATFDLLYHFFAIVIAFELIARREMANLHAREDERGRGRSGGLTVAKPRGFRSTGATRGPMPAGGLG